MNKILNQFVVILFLFGTHLNAQLKKTYEYKFDDPILNLSTKDYNFYIQNLNGIFSINNNSLVDSKKINSVCISPLGNQLLVIEDKKLLLFQVGEEIKKELEVKFEITDKIKKIVSDTYGKKYYILTDNGNLKVISNLLEIDDISNNFKLKDIDWSNNLNSLYAVSDNSLFVLEKNNLKEEKTLRNGISALYFSNSFFEIIIGYFDGKIDVLNQKFESKLNFELPSTIEITSIASHNEDPHIFVSNTNGEIFSINKISKEIIKVDSSYKTPVLLNTIFNKTGDKKNEYVISHSSENFISVWSAINVVPDYKKFVNDKIEIFKSNFFQLKDNESESEFNNRTDPLLATKVFKVEEQRLKDSIANVSVISEPTIDITDQYIIVGIDPFEKIQISKNSNLLKSYLKVSEVHFEINNKNGFYIKNLKINNSLDGNYLVFDPVLDLKIKDSLDKEEALRIKKENEAIALAKEISRQEIELKNNLTSLVQDLKEEGKINEVDLTVDSKLIREKDSTGEEELNLKINFISKGITAEVGAKTSDYPPGKYNLFDSPSAKTLVDFFLTSTRDNLIEYLDPGTRITFKLTGSTDNSGISSTIPYEEEYGVFKNFPYYFQGSLNGMNLNSIDGITSNSQLGFLRTYSVRDFIKNYTDLFDSTKNKFIHYSEEADKRGAEYRKIQIEMTIHSIDKLMSLNQNNNSLSDVDIEIPSGTKKINGYALVIGNEDYASYQSDLDTNQNVPFASKDAESFKNYLNIMYGIPNENIILIVNATYGEMSQAITKFKKLMEFDGENNNFVFYYSGHGMPHEQTNDPYLMPVDISGYTVDQAISLNGLLSDFKSYNYKRLTMVLDACFSGISRSPEPLIKVKGVGNRRIKEKVKEDSKSQSKSFDFDFTIDRISINGTTYNNPNIGDNMILISSSSGEETSLTDNENKHGLFTYYLLKFLKESNGDITLESLFEKTRKKVGVESIMKYNKPQTPELLFGKNINAGNDQFLEYWAIEIQKSSNHFFWKYLP